MRLDYTSAPASPAPGPGITNILDDGTRNGARSVVPFPYISRCSTCPTRRLWRPCTCRRGGRTS